jgi:hypothetical protein
VLLTAALSVADEISFFVSTEGRDNWSGRFADPRDDDGPFATLDRAQRAVRDLKSAGRLTKPVVVYFRGGLYPLKKKIFFLPKDSGTKQAPITYKAFSDEQVQFSGGRTLTGWTNIRDNKWVCDIPEARESGWKFQALFVNVERRERSRRPNNGYYRVKDPMEREGRPFHHYRYQFVFSPGDLIPGWRNLSDVEIVVLHFWSDARSPIESINSKMLTVKF